MKQNKKIICLDFDDVIPRAGTASKLMGIFGRKLKFLKLEVGLLEDNMNPRKFFRAVKDIVAFCNGMDFQKIKKFMLRFGPRRGVRETLKKLKRRGYKVVIVSTNDGRFIKEYLKKYSIEKYIDHIYASRFGIKNNIMTGKIYGDVIKTEKTGVVRKIENLYKVKKSNITYVGDGLTDLPIMKMVGTSILFCPNNLTKAEVFTNKKFREMQKKGRMFIVENKNLKEILAYI